MATVQRWYERRNFFVPESRRFQPRAYEVVEVADDRTAKDFVLRHHYSASYPAARRRYGLFRAGVLCGMAVFSVPCQPAVLTNVFAAPVANLVELGRFVLLDEVGFNGESWFLGRCWSLLRRDGFRGVVSFSDPVPRQDLRGHTIFPGHLGIIYQAGSACYLGRSTPRTLRLLPDGTVLSERAVQKLRTPGDQQRKKGWRYSASRLEAFGAAPAPERGSGDLAQWARAWVPFLTRPLRHPGNHRYAFALDRSLLATMPAAQPYPKRETTMQLSKRELATVLAALRYWQQDLEDMADQDEDPGPISIEHFGGGLEPLSVEEIDQLCERLNQA